MVNENALSKYYRGTIFAIISNIADTFSLYECHSRLR